MVILFENRSVNAQLITVLLHFLKTIQHPQHFELPFFPRHTDFPLLVVIRGRIEFLIVKNLEFCFAGQKVAVVGVEVIRVCNVRFFSGVFVHCNLWDKLGLLFRNDYGILVGGPLFYAAKIDRVPRWGIRE
jgi:hypothetical protein